MNEVPQQAGAPKPEARQGKWGAEACDWIYTVVIAVVVCILVFTFLGRTVTVVGSSMVPTLSEGDRLVVSRLFYQPKRGDIVVFKMESFMSEPLVKRVVAVAGQTVDIDFDAGVVYVDGTELQEDYVNSLTLEPEDFTEPVTVPEGCVFVLGDNRNRSTDSRDEDIGCVDVRCIIGKAWWRISPINQFGTVYK